MPNSSVVYQLIMGGYQQPRPVVVQNDAVDALLSLKTVNNQLETTKKRGPPTHSEFIPEDVRMRPQFIVSGNGGPRMQFAMAAPATYIGANAMAGMDLHFKKAKVSSDAAFSLNESSLKWVPDNREITPSIKMNNRGVYKCGLCGAAKFKHSCKKTVKTTSSGTSIDPVNMDKIEGYIIIKERTRTVSAYRGPVLPPPELIEELRMRSKPMVSNSLILHPSAALLCEQGNPNFVSTGYTRVVYTNGYTPSYFRIPRHYESDDNHESSSNSISNGATSNIISNSISTTDEKGSEDLPSSLKA